MSVAEEYDISLKISISASQEKQRVATLKFIKYIS
jgi:hypothetical protein